jgi:adenine-specific DNA-methyltransferase
MRSELDVLLDKVEDPALRADLRAQMERIKAKRTFGLVFESHLPERVRLPEHPVRVGLKVARRDDANSPTFEVLAVEGDTATMRQVRNSDGSLLSEKQAMDVTEDTVQIDSLIVIADFGQPIFPGLRHLGSIERGDDKPAHVVIKGENHHVLEALQFTHAGKVDCIYIDPPYNTGARDWKYDNNYVDDSDAYRHSKWLAFMERRLLLAKQLLNPEDSVLIVSIDEKEYLRLGLLLEQVFAGCRRQMVTVVISPAGQARGSEFSRVEEYLFVVYLGAASVTPSQDTMLGSTPREAGDKASPAPIQWENLLRRGTDAGRGDRPNQFYPIFVDPHKKKIVALGIPLLDESLDRATVKAPDGTVAVWPLRTDGSEGRWRVSREGFEALLNKGFGRLGSYNRVRDRWSVNYLLRSDVQRIEKGEIKVLGQSPEGFALLERSTGIDLTGLPKTVWNREAHNAGNHGSAMLRGFIPGRSFPFPKSLYAVEDAIRFFVKDKPEAVVLDFFGGSGTTTHAVARLNGQDGGRRQSIVVTNNEVSADEEKELRRKGLRPGDPEWETLGIFEHITRPRITAAITGATPEGEPVKGQYKFTDEFPMAEGFEENVKFFELTYLDGEDVELDIAFSEIAPLLWLRAGGRGPILDESLDAAGRRKPYASNETYGVLFNPDRWRGFVGKLPKVASAAFIVTDSQTTFAGIASELPGALDVVRLYENYLTTFAINERSA